jgi:hypothetical protein
MLSDREIQTVKPRGKLYRKADGGGLCLEVTPKGSTLWRLRYLAASAADLTGIGRRLFAVH